MSTSDEQHAPEPEGRAVDPEAGLVETPAETPLEAAPDVDTAGPGDARSGDEPAGATSDATEVLDRVGAAPTEGATAGSVPSPAPSPAPGPIPAPPAPGAPSAGPGTSPTPVTSAPAPGSAAWQPPTPTPPLGAPVPMRPPLPQPAPADLSADTAEGPARHAVARPTPVPPAPLTPPPPASLPQRVPAATTLAGPPHAAGAVAGAAAGAVAGAGAAGLAAATTGGAHDAAGATTTKAADATDTAITPGDGTTPPLGPASSELFPDPNAPRTITVGTHVLGVIVGILLPLASILVTALGASRILAVEADGWIAKVDALGIVLVTLGALLLLACVLLSLWTPSVGIVGGALLTLAGGFALYAPGLTRSGVLDVLTSEGWRPTVIQAVVVATSGTVLVAGILLLGSGIVSTAARRHGIHLGAFRERHRA